MSNSPVSDPPSTPQSGSPSGESDFPSSLTGSVPCSPTTTTSLRCSFDDVPDEILWVIFSYVGSFLSRLPILGVLCCCHRFRRIALPLLYRNLEFTTPRHFVQMRDAWAMVPKVFEQHVTTVTLGCIDSHHYPIHFDVLWPNITTFTWALTSLTVLRLTGITLSFDFFLFTTSSLTHNIEVTLEGCVVNREALNPVIELHFSKLTIFDICWKKHALGDVQDGAGPIIVAHHPRSNLESFQMATPTDGPRNHLHLASETTGQNGDGSHHTETAQKERSSQFSLFLT
ncbi:hypothetical protein EV368DRAFT_85642 [Lentinula lateritia]|nr:hypothetical protein EV368DRAFT_85642 [Lentinula lateritia]